VAWWGEHHWAVVLITVICVTQALLIGGLLLQRMKRRRATLELKQRIIERHHRTAALRLLPIDHLRLHIKGLEPQAKVWGNTEKGLAYDDERRDVKKGDRS
jgi:hypothetical protein